MADAPAAGPEGDRRERQQRRTHSKVVPLVLTPAGGVPHQYNPSALKCAGEGFSCLQTSQESRTQAMRTPVDWLPHRLQ